MAYNVVVTLQRLPIQILLYLKLVATVTTYRKKASLTTPRFGTSVCWTPIATDSNSNHLSEKSVNDHPQIWHLCVMDPYSN